VAKKFKDLRDKMSPEARAASEEKATVYSKEMALDELRTARRITQESLAKVLGVKQSAISKIERRTNMYVSTLESVIEAMGGRLEIEAVFPDGKVKLNQEVRKRKLARAV
jgi:transcriptional regulator with XRE-family HTH domain